MVVILKDGKKNIKKVVAMMGMEEVKVEAAQKNVALAEVEKFKCSFFLPSLLHFWGDCSPHVRPVLQSHCIEVVTHDPPPNHHHHHHKRLTPSTHPTTITIIIV